MKMILGGYFVDIDSKRHKLPIITDPDDSEISKTLSKLKVASGVIGLRCQPTPETGPYELILYADNGRFLLMLNETDKNGESNVRTITEADANNELITILGECYPGHIVTTNFKLISSVFRRFLHEGDVSKEIMS